MKDPKTRARYVCLVLVWVLVFSWWMGGQAMAADKDRLGDTTEATTTTTVATEPAPTASDEVDDEPTIVTGGEGVDGLVPAPQLRADGDVPTLTERFPGSAYTWDGRWGRTDFNRVLQRMFADPALRALVGWGTFVTRTMAWVWTVPAIGTDIIDGINQGLRESGWWQVFALGLVFAAGVYMAWMAAFRMRALDAVQHMLWVFGLGVFAVAMLWTPGAMIGKLNEATNTLSRQTMSAAAELSPEVGLRDNTTQAPTFNGDPGIDAVRKAQDVWWRVFVVIPWATGEFGRVDNLPAGTIDQVLAIHTGDSGTLTAEERAVLDGTATTDCDGKQVSGTKGLLCMRTVTWSNYRDIVLEKLPGVSPWVNGKYPMDRAGIAVSALLVAIPSGLLMMGLSLAILWWSYKGIIWAAAGCVYALRGMVPVSGPPAFIRYVQATAATFLYRIVASGALALVLLVETVVSAKLAERGWYRMAVGQLVATAAMTVLWVQHRRSSGQKVVPRPHLVRKAQGASATVRRTVQSTRNAARAAVWPSAVLARSRFDATRPPKATSSSTSTAPGWQPLSAPLALPAGPEVVREAGPAPSRHPMPIRNVEPEVLRVGPQPRRVHAVARVTLAPPRAVDAAPARERPAASARELPAVAPRALPAASARELPAVAPRALPAASDE